ncbi:hydrolase [Carboxylicivirga caseinilyticus]|uniref:hydrolase n=1 Tax=Carboxylicivirga caseinilyticus TaxID=3417572 RepID=UPI003D33389C|nr:hydrolase [Marinilabiliaceae bacterium A049]
MRVLKDNAVAMIVDIQERLFPHIYEHEQLAKNVEILIQGLQALEVPVVVSEQYKKGLGETIEPIEKLIATDPHIEKMAFSCCDEPKLMEKTELTGKRFVILAGMETHICVLQTAIDLLERGYHPVVVEDCVSSRTLANKQNAIERMRQEGVIITSYESLLFELCRYAGSDVFKTISKLVK